MIIALTTALPNSNVLICRVNLSDLKLGPMMLFQSPLLSGSEDCNPLPQSSPIGRSHSSRQWTIPHEQITH